MTVCFVLFKISSHYLYMSSLFGTLTTMYESLTILDESCCPWSYLIQHSWMHKLTIGWVVSWCELNFQLDQLYRWYKQKPDNYFIKKQIVGGVIMRAWENNCGNSNGGNTYLYITGNLNEKLFWIVRVAECLWCFIHMSVTLLNIWMHLPRT